MNMTRRDVLRAMGVAAAGAGVGRAAGAEPLPLVKVYAAPEGVALSKRFSVNIERQAAPVYVAKIAPGEDARRWRAMDKIEEDIFEEAGFVSFDMGGRVEVVVRCAEAVKGVKVLPTAAGVKATFSGREVRLVMEKAGTLVVEINGDVIHSLHLFGNPLEQEMAREGDQGVIYFGPGVHELKGNIELGDGQTLYLASGAVVRGVGKGPPVVHVKGKGVRVMGRGILDGALCPVHSRNLLFVEASSDVLVEGIVLNDSSTWTMPVRRSERVVVRNVKVFGHRPNSDGIDICNSRDVKVEGCFLRTLDDLVVVKTDKGQGEVTGVRVSGCVLWNQVAHALSIGAELRENVSDVVFADCDVIHDIGREWTLRIFHCDDAVISNVRFERIRIEESRRLISLWIGKAVWSKDQQRGHIQDVSFEEITAVGNPATVEVKGFDDAHRVERVRFKGVVVNGKALTLEDVQHQAFSDDVVVAP